ncbi:Protein of unknown function [Gryllus bimaculatus]|nr:Protein of unknown function [Gryllus bimaculatus]
MAPRATLGLRPTSFPKTRAGRRGGARRLAGHKRRCAGGRGAAPHRLPRGLSPAPSTHRHGGARRLPRRMRILHAPCSNHGVWTDAQNVGRVSEGERAMRQAGRGRGGGGCGKARRVAHKAGDVTARDPRSPALFPLHTTRQPPPPIPNPLRNTLRPMALPRQPFPPNATHYPPPKAINSGITSERGETDQVGSPDLKEDAGLRSPRTTQYRTRPRRISKPLSLRRLREPWAPPPSPLPGGGAAAAAAAPARLGLEWMPIKGGVGHAAPGGARDGDGSATAGDNCIVELPSAALE